MKLNEIVAPNIQFKRARGGTLMRDVQAGSVKRESPLTKLGTGSYAAAYQHKKRPGTVIKVGKYTESPAKDGYLSYIKTIKTRMASNPYFPRVYEIRIYPTLPEINRTTPHAGEYVIEMEALEPMDNLSDEEIDSMGRKIFRNWDNMGLDDYSTEYRIRTLARSLSSALHGKNPVIMQIQDRKLLEAIGLIRHMLKTTDTFFEDLHHENIMARRTSVGPQLVIIDPIADSGL